MVDNYLNVLHVENNSIVKSIFEYLNWKTDAIIINMFISHSLQVYNDLNE